MVRDSVGGSGVPRKVTPTQGGKEVCVCVCVCVCVTVYECVRGFSFYVCVCVCVRAYVDVVCVCVWRRCRKYCIWASVRVSAAGNTHRQICQECREKMCSSLNGREDHIKPQHTDSIMWCKIEVFWRAKWRLSYPESTSGTQLKKTIIGRSMVTEAES